ncbi:MAG: type IV pilus secretin PilQ [Thermodesulfovibrio sp.]|nr:type IV pilus secretin PilQ [Thermodesulfovibrio sp.]
MIKIFILSLVFFVFSNVSIYAAEIVSVVQQEGLLRIELAEKRDFKILPQDDPFKLKIQIMDIEPGILNRKIIFHEGLVSEISAQKSEGSSIVDILLTEPISFEVTKQDNSILVLFDRVSSKTEKIAKIIDLFVERKDDGYEISIQADREIPEPTVEREGEYVNVRFSNVKFEAEISKDIPMYVRRDGDLVTVSFLITRDFDIKPLYLGDEVLIEVAKKEVLKEPVEKEKPVVSVTPSPLPLAVNSERTISLDLQDADIVGVFRLLGDISGYNIVIHPEVKGKITLKLINVPWTQALDIVCKTFHLEKLYEGNIIRIAPVKVFQEEKRLLAETKELFKKAEDTQTKIILLKYSAPDKVKAAVEGAKLLSPQGNIVIDERIRAIVVKDIPSALKEIETFVATLDKPIRQILLEARILEISSTFAKSLGFEWGIQWAPPDSRMNIVGSQAGRAVSGGTTPIAINLPATSGAVGTGTAAFTIGYINASGTFALDLRISALQETGKGKVISNPKVITLDHQKARIVQGETIPYGEKDVQTGLISTKFKDVAIIVETTPHLIDEKSLQLDVSIIKEDLVEFVNIGGVYAPRTTKIEGVTRVTLRDGETLVIGGIYKKKDSLRESRVPFLSDIPIAGELFKSTGRDENIYEVMIFITPRILNL